MTVQLACGTTSASAADDDTDDDDNDDTLPVVQRVPLLWVNSRLVEALQRLLLLACNQGW